MHLDLRGQATLCTITKKNMDPLAPITTVEKVSYLIILQIVIWNIVFIKYIFNKINAHEILSVPLSFWTPFDNITRPYEWNGVYFVDYGYYMAQSLQCFSLLLALCSIGKRYGMPRHYLCWNILYGD